MNRFLLATLALSTLALVAIAVTLFWRMRRRLRAATEERTRTGS